MESLPKLIGPKIVNIRAGNGERSHIIYAELRDEKGELWIAATLECIVSRLPDLLKPQT
jgi:hypothetical protein